MARRALLILLVVAAVIAVVLVRQRQRADQAEWQAGIDSTRIINVTFDRASELVVSRLRGTMLTRTEAAGCVGLCHGVQLTRAPVSIAYSVNLRGLPASAYRWNAVDRVMYVALPDVTVEAPNVDMARAEVRQQGLWISRDMGRQLQGRAAINLRDKAAIVAHEPATILKARDAAREAVQQLIAGPLVAAGERGVTVTVRATGDPLPSDRQWDVSRSIEDVLADPRFKR